MTTLTHILLIDDDAVDRMIVRRALAASDLVYDLVEAPDGATGLHYAQARSFDCVLLDYRLPDVDAFDLLSALLAPEGNRQAVMMLTGEADPDAALRLMRAGALDHLAKAEVTPSGLARAIRFARARRGFVGELEAARRDAEEKSVALDLLNRQKSMLFSIVAHDLRNPFQVLLGLSAVLSEAVATRDHASIERRAQGIQQAAAQAHTLMEGLFAWASLEMDSVALVLDDLPLADVAAEAVENCVAAAATKGVVLDIACDGIPPVRSHREMLATILRNLTSNAIKFTAPGGRIDVTGRLDGDRVLVSVADSGVGMSPDAVARLFRPDRRTSTNGTAGERGTGLGLLLCHDVASRLGTTLAVASEVGRGTVFSFTIPIA